MEKYYLEKQEKDKQLLLYQDKIKKQHQKVFWLTNILFGIWLICLIIGISLIARQIQITGHFKNTISFLFVFAVAGILTFSYQQYYWYKKNLRYKKFINAKNSKDIVDIEYNNTFLTKHYKFLMILNISLFILFTVLTWTFTFL